MPAEETAHRQPQPIATVDGSELLGLLVANSGNGIAMAQISMPGLDGRPASFLIVLAHGKSAEELKTDLIRREVMIRTPLRAPGSLH